MVHLGLSLVVVAALAALVFHDGFNPLAYGFVFMPAAITYVVVSTATFLIVRRGWRGAVASHAIALVAGVGAVMLFVR